MKKLVIPMSDTCVQEDSNLHCPQFDQVLFEGNDNPISYCKLFNQPIKKKIPLDSCLWIRKSSIKDIT